jgi:sensor c-di-GMP phosphodiesterase-like protein
MGLSKKEKLLSIATAVTAAALSILLFTLLSYWLEQKKQHTELQTLTDIAYNRTHSVLLEIESGFKALEKVPASGCRDETLVKLRSVVKSSKYLKSASIELGQNIYCSDSGLVYRDKPRPDYVDDDGTMVWLNRQNLFGPKLNTVYIQSGNIILSTLHELFLNIIAAENAGIVIFSTKSGQVIARYPETAAVDPAVMQRMTRAGGSYSDGKRLYHANHDGKLSIAVITFTIKKPLAGHWRDSIWLWLPIGLLCGLLAGYASYKRMELQYTPVQKLISAIRNREFLVYYQPIVSLHNGKCIGAETLIRWKRLDGVMINPDLFIPLAEDSGLIESLTDIMFESAMRDMAEQLRTGNFYISFNLSAHDMAQSRYFDMISARLHQLGIAPAKIAIEATERGFLDVAQANDIIKLYHEAGHSVFIDDFGTGYSSLSYLQHLAIDVIKIDKAFVDAIDTGSATSSVIIHIIAMAKQLKLKIVAEGVETAAQAEFLKQHGVDAGQGFYFAQPMPANDFLRYIDQDRDLADL